VTENLSNSSEPEVNRKKGEVARHLLLAVLGLTAPIAIIQGIVGWIARWDTVKFSNHFFITGAIVATVGLLSVLGNFSARGNFGVQYGQSSSDMNLSERTQLWISDVKQGYNALIVCVASGALLIGLAILVDKLFV
jgi:hypothetical protein